jgi:hypothetical protein
MSNFSCYLIKSKDFSTSTLRTWRSYAEETKWHIIKYMQQYGLGFTNALTLRFENILFAKNLGSHLCDIKMQWHVQLFASLNEKQGFLYFNLAYLKKLRRRDQVTYYKIHTAVRLWLYKRVNTSIWKYCFC